MKSKSIVLLQSILLLITMAIGLLDEITDIVYYATNQFYDPILKNVTLFFIIASPGLEVIGMVYMLGKIEVHN
jgi:hypothetical protein